MDWDDKIERFKDRSDRWITDDAPIIGACLFVVAVIIVTILLFVLVGISWSAQG